MPNGPNRRTFLATGRRTPQTAETAGTTGMIVGATRSRVTVRLADGRTVTARTKVLRRTLRPGDRVQVEGRFATPLFRSVAGLVEEVTPRSVTIAGVRCHLDEHSVVRPAGALRRGVHVGALCVHNQREETLTVQALFLGG
jgi:translation initiation factor IF-1